MTRYWLGVWLPLIVWLVVIYERTRYHLAPFEFWWVVWVLASGVTAARVGWGLAKLHERRKGTQAAIRANPREAG